MQFNGLHVLGSNATPPDDAVVLRNSAVDSFLLCPSRVGYSQTEGFLSVPSEAMSWGTMIHSACESDIDNGLRAWTPQDLENEWVKGVERDGHNLYDLATPAVIDASTTEAAVAMSLWQRDVYPRVQAMSPPLLELRMETQLGTLPNGREVWVHGTPDAMFPVERETWDWKTSKDGWKEGKPESGGQPSMYPWLAKQQGLDVGDVFRFFVYNRKRSEWVEWVTHRTPEQVDSYLHLLWQIAKTIDAQAFTYKIWDTTFGKAKRGWWCGPKYCGAWNVCHGKHQQDNTWEQQIADPAVTGWVK